MDEVLGLFCLAWPGPVIFPHEGQAGLAGRPSCRASRNGRPRLTSSQTRLSILSHPFLPSLSPSLKFSAHDEGSNKIKSKECVKKKSAHAPPAPRSVPCSSVHCTQAEPPPPHHLLGKQRDFSRPCKQPNPDEAGANITTPRPQMRKGLGGSLGFLGNPSARQGAWAPGRIEMSKQYWLNSFRGSAHVHVRWG